MEGVINYLDIAAVKETLTMVSSVASGSILAMTCLTLGSEDEKAKRKNSDHGSRADFERVLKKLGEPHRWFLPTGTHEEFFGAMGFEVLECLDIPAMCKKFCPESMAVSVKEYTKTFSETGRGYTLVLLRVK
eukprot:CAMPEP_0185269104 /NCGR_PEP_ID=MMETSP1359-20130426/38875_1 /TAXON_ID=552665 /ORGANISM="Bigelowiella longifila, Strain CCMP242" /LENGTH=131 /DNA_ID=CAMNT_0027860123 /DNA_START=171 /DNA_END=566 /DNA_ORIENTATION=-